MTLSERHENILGHRREVIAHRDRNLPNDRVGGWTGYMAGGALADTRAGSHAASVNSLRAPTLSKGSLPPNDRAGILRSVGIRSSVWHAAQACSNPAILFLR